ncbi:MAG: 23S rRNA pseudouridylate synthase B [Gammaproteobacteria bacterium RIFCSPLOWO2_02_FULL_38_11]|nr:MAG: 23S rRNA pseudouridylate synthase B [Gammaproteobacteria bacterium RIFCSPLOWO2_02_FULL_38_11]OGT77929.1 MAG: 23S rRNA pseudouridylate synthase B [Gammaproteobacteria bacterium RIFCSPLOWO2_12_FULL_38_14]
MKTQQEKVRIQKTLSDKGVGSRREIEEWIRQGRVFVNDVQAEIGMKISPRDRIKIDGQVVRHMEIKRKNTRVIMYHKPEGEVCARKDPQQRKTIFENLPVLRQSRWIAVGRLDLNTSGLILLTTEGELANRLMHPSYEVEREYAVRVLGQVTAEMIRNLKKGVMLEGEPCAFDDVVDAGGTGVNHWYKVILREGKNREVRKLWESQGVKVSRLIRTRFGAIGLPRLLRPGRWRELTPEEIQSLHCSFVK